MPLPSTQDRGLTMTCYTAEPGSPSDDAMKLLASWAATTADTGDHLDVGHARKHRRSPLTQE